MGYNSYGFNGRGATIRINDTVYRAASWTITANKPKRIAITDIRKRLAIKALTARIRRACYS